MPVNYDHAVSRAPVFDRARNRDLEFDGTSRVPREISPSEIRRYRARTIREFPTGFMIAAKRYLSKIYIYILRYDE